MNPAAAASSTSACARGANKATAGSCREAKGLSAAALKTQHPFRTSC